MPLFVFNFLSIYSSNFKIVLLVFSAQGKYALNQVQIEMAESYCHSLTQYQH
jgi:hypothetical protein